MNEPNFKNVKLTIDSSCTNCSCLEKKNCFLKELDTNAISEISGEGCGKLTCIANGQRFDVTAENGLDIPDPDGKMISMSALENEDTQLMFTMGNEA